MVLLDLLRATRALDEAGVEHALVGGLALAVWGAPRATKDIDLLVRTVDLERAVQVAKDQGFDIVALRMKFRYGMELQRVTRARDGELLTLDFLLVNDSLEPVWASRVRLAVGAGELTVISRDALIQMKALAGRPQDIADIERLRAIDR
ncbi:MAG: nucleotidyltransferase [Polyangiaceae bacterium]|nr:nucleotidyltransferase [Polyangiaceae bacterium]